MKNKNAFLFLNFFILTAVALMLTGCATHSIFLASNKTSFDRDITIFRYPAHTNKVFVSQGPLPAAIKARVLGYIDVGTVMYNAPHIVYCRMAQKARDIGADAVVEVKIWYQISGWAWAAPHGRGIAIRLAEGQIPDYSSMKGEWY